MPKRVTHLIIGLGLGGAETMLYQVLLNKSGPDTVHRVISLGQGSYYEDPIKDLGVDLTVLPFKKRPVSVFFKLKKLLSGTDTLCCWMYHACFIGEAAFRKERKKGGRIIWNIRHGNLDKENNSRSTIIANGLCARRSGKVDLIAYNGNEARRVHEEAGYCRETGAVLENGCDTEEYSRVPGADRKIRDELGVPDGKKIVISAAKDLPIKDLPTFITAFGRVHKDMPDTVALMCGSGVTKDNERLTALLRAAGLRVDEDVFLLGMRHDIPTLFSASDLYVLHSAGEAFPNTLLQAMACGCPCVTTDVGDARRILDDEERTVKPGDAEALAKAIESALSEPEEGRRIRVRRNRSAVEERYDIKRVVKNYEMLF
ncbi:MAG: glycosyltransferase [Clostridia bacterium]|nr:glycosyltransferase [Clostridia bacterium]